MNPESGEIDSVNYDSKVGESIGYLKRRGFNYAYITDEEINFFRSDLSSSGRIEGILPIEDEKVKIAILKALKNSGAQKGTVNFENIFKLENKPGQTVTLKSDRRDF